MEIQGTEKIITTKKTLWKALNTPSTLKTCIPGCQEFTKIAKNQFSATIRLAIGPMKATFNADITLSNIKPPTSYTLKGAAMAENKMGGASGSAHIKLIEQHDHVQLTYQAKAMLSGRLGQLAQRLVDGVTKLLIKKFFTALNKFIQDEASEKTNPNRKVI